MKKLYLPAALALSVAACSPADQPATESAIAADAVYTNGKIYTVDDGNVWAEAVAIKDGVFVAVGSAADMDAVTGGETEVVDLGGQFVMPGIVDMHAHPFSGVDLGTGGANLSNPGNMDAVLADVKAYIEANPDKDVVLGGNWLVGGALAAKDSPDKALLDEIAPDVPVFLLSQSGHSGWANSKALKMAGVDASFDNTGAYIFDRYDGTNEPSGTVRESGMVLIMNALHYLAPEEFAGFFVDEIARYSRYGVTAIQPAEGSPSWYRGAALLEDQGRLDVRLFPAMDWLTSQLRVLNDDETKALVDDLASYQTEQIRTHYVKIFADGAADSHTQLMKKPYADDPDNLGTMYLPFEEYRAAILDIYSKGISVHVHVMGDGTAEKIIDIFEEAEAAYPDSEATLHMGHAQLLDPVELERFAALRTGTMNHSPMLAVPHPQMDLFIKTPLGEERHQSIYATQTALKLGIPLGFGSDFPSSLVPDPMQLWYMEGWVTRMVPGEPKYGSINADEAITVEQAIRGFTLGGAEALGSGYSDWFGSIKVGKSADMVVLNQNLLQIPETEIHKTEVQKTIFRGRVVYTSE